MNKLYGNSPMISEVKKARFKPRPIIAILIFLGVFSLLQTLSSLPVMIYGMPKLMKFISEYSMDIISGVKEYDYAQIMEESITFTESLMNDNIGMLLMLFGTIIPLIGMILYGKIVDKRSMNSFGFYKKRAVPKYLLGMVVGFVLITSSIMVLYALDFYSFKRVENCNYVMIVLYFFAYLIQGAEEEIALRGFLMIGLNGRRTSIIHSVMMSSLVFTLLHAMNPGMTLLGLFNIFLFAVFAALYMLESGSIWGVCAIHSVWNFVQGNIFGIEVSGTASAASIFITEEKGSSLISGGTVGLEGSIICAAIMLIAIATILVKSMYRYKNTPEDQRYIPEVDNNYL